MFSEAAELPDGWVQTELGELIQPSKAKVEPSSLGKTTYVGLEHIESNTGALIGYGLASDVRSTKSVFKRGDLLYGKLRPYLNKVYLSELDGICSTDILVFPKSEHISNQYIAYRFLSDDFVRYANANSTGVQHPRVKFEALSEFDIPLPPLNEQRRIVAKIEELTAHSRRAREALDDVPKLIDQFRQSVLAAAFRGDLTANWREKHSSLETATQIVQRVKKRRISKANPSKVEKIEEIYSHLEAEDSECLPISWSYVALDKLADSFNYGTSQKSSKTGDVPVLRMGNLQGGEIDWSDLVFSSDQEEISKYTLKPNTVLFNRTNSPELVGKTSIYRGEQPAIFAGYLIRINNFDELDPEYLNYALNSDYAKSYCWQVKTDGVSQSNINAQKLGKFEVPFCSLEEQREIVRLLDRYMASIKIIEEQYQDNYSSLDILGQSILAKAFRGELVPQDPNDEPAAVLLDRIRAEREKLGSTKKKGRTSRKKSQQDSSEQLSL